MRTAVDDSGILTVTFTTSLRSPLTLSSVTSAKYSAPVCALDPTEASNKSTTLVVDPLGIAKS